MTTMKRMRIRMMVLFLFFVLFFGLLMFRSEVERNRQSDFIYHSCVIRNENTDRLNTLYSGLIEIEKKNPFVATSPKTIHNRIHMYRQAMQKRVPCVKP